MDILTGYRGSPCYGLILSNSVYNILSDAVSYIKMLNTYGPLKAIMQLQLKYTDNPTQQITTDNSWQVAPGPVTYINLYGGEDYDARLEPAGWNLPNF